MKIAMPASGVRIERFLGRAGHTVPAVNAIRFATAVLAFGLGTVACRSETESDLLLYGGKEDYSSFPATVLLRRDFEDGHKSLCTGTFIRDDVLLTAAHCVRSLKEISFGPTVESLGKEDRIRALSWTANPAFNPQGGPLSELPNDVAVVRFPKGSFTGAVASIGQTAPTAGQTISVVGYGATKFDPKDVEKVEGIGQRSMGTAVIGSVNSDSLEWIVYEGDSSSALILQGDSGGPIYSSSGELVGIISFRELGEEPDGKWAARSVAVNIVDGPSKTFIASELSKTAPSAPGSGPSDQPSGPDGQPSGPDGQPSGPSDQPSSPNGQPSGPNDQP
jgi:hypothetical protein